MKKIVWFLLVMTGLFLFSGCSSNQDMIEVLPEENEQILLTADDMPERKIIYTVESVFDVDDMNDSISTLKNLINEDEWFDVENTGSSYASFTIRIKTDRIDEFTNALKDNFQVRSFSKVGKDISLQYQDKTNKINSLNLQITRLQELYDEASLSDMIIINQQLSDLETEKMHLEGELNQFDSLIEYSEVNIIFYGSEVITRSPFFNRLSNGFINGLKSVLQALDGIAIALSFLLPIVLIFGPVAYGIYYLSKKYKAKKDLKKRYKK